MGILASEGRGCSWSLPDPHPWICNSDRGRGVRGPRLAGGGAGGTRALLSAGSPQPSLRPEPQWQSRRAVSAPSWATDNGLLHAHEKQAARARPVRVFLIDAQRMLPTTAFKQAQGRQLRLLRLSQLPSKNNRAPPFTALALEMLIATRRNRRAPRRPSPGARECPAGLPPPPLRAPVSHTERRGPSMRNNPRHGMQMNE